MLQPVLMAELFTLLEWCIVDSSNEQLGRAGWSRFPIPPPSPLPVCQSFPYATRKIFLSSSPPSNPLQPHGERYLRQGRSACTSWS